MTNEELNAILFRRLSKEYDDYKKWLLRQPPEVILDNASKYTVITELMIVFENNDMTDAQAKAMMRQHRNLEKIYDSWKEDACIHMDGLLDAAEAYADKVAEKLANRQMRGR